MQTDYALKEWDAQVQALLRGEVALILRKGGILETHEGFEVEHGSFYLYPTYLHQNAPELRPAFRGLLHPDPQPGTVTLPAHAEVLAVWKVESLDKLLALEDMQALSAAAIERRFAYRGRPWLHALLLRVTRLTDPPRFAETPEMLGCQSWVPLDRGSLPAGSQDGSAAHDNAQLAGVRAEIERRLA